VPPDFARRRLSVLTLGCAFLVAVAVALAVDGDDTPSPAIPATTDARCAPLETDGEVSCRNGADVMINLRRWLEGAPASELSIRDYRTYVVNHEVGHALGYDHVDCPGPGAVAPVMVQQTLGLGGCLPNPWPHPDGAATPAGS
jgi:hypothetical protein